MVYFSFSFICAVTLFLSLFAALEMFSISLLCLCQVVCKLSLMNMFFWLPFRTLSITSLFLWCYFSISLVIHCFCSEIPFYFQAQKKGKSVTFSLFYSAFQENNPSANSKSFMLSLRFQVPAEEVLCTHTHQLLQIPLLWGFPKPGIDR